MPAQDVDRQYDRFRLIVNGPALFNAVVAGVELGVFAFLSEHPKAEFEDIRRHVGIPEHSLRVLLLGLCASEMVLREDGRYHNAAPAEELLAKDGPDSWRHILLGWQRIYYPAFAHTTSALRSGTNTALSAHPGTEPTLYQRLARDPETEEILHASMAAFTLQSMSGLLENAELATVRRLLDVGGGDGTTAFRIAERLPEAEVTVFEMPSVGRLAERGIPSGTAGRVTVHPGNIFEDDFPEGFDAILFSHVLEVFSPDQIRLLLAKAVRALPPGGRIFVYGFHASADETAGVFSARLSLYLNVLASGQGMAYPAEDYERWLREAGCDRVTTYAGLPYEHGLVVAAKP
ncbi:methyltransferase [Streptomyces coeruleoprunus]|uniref:Methyltransferase n=1 Tax=Streptomyces coeruleoprunus TaxID=285563 RepID=A0ABV9XA44_9ACTN